MNYEVQKSDVPRGNHDSSSLSREESSQMESMRRFLPVLFSP